MAQEPKDEKGRPYHIRLGREDAADVALLPGDPGRVPLIAKKLERAAQVSSNREYTAYSGYAGRERVLVMSTGIGGPSTAIAVEELAGLGVRTMIRVGTCGAITPKLDVGSVVIADAAVRMEGTSWQYVSPGYPAAATPGVVLALKRQPKGWGLRRRSAYRRRRTRSTWVREGSRSGATFRKAERTWSRT